jgi:hypothetical protein
MERVTAAMTARARRKVITVHRTQRTAAWLLGLIVTVSGLACTSTQTADTSGGATATSDACFSVRRVSSFSPLSERFVYVRLQDDKQFLLALDRLYMGLPFAIGIAMHGEYSRVCSDTGASITFKDTGGPAIARIIRVEAVASREAARKLVDERSIPKPKG